MRTVTLQVVRVYTQGNAVVPVYQRSSGSSPLYLIGTYGILVELTATLTSFQLLFKLFSFLSNVALAGPVLIQTVGSRGKLSNEKQCFDSSI